MPVLPNLTYGQVLYENAFRRSLATSYSGTQTPGFGYINAYDWADWSLFLTELTTNTRDLTFSFPTNTTFDTFVMYVVPFETALLPDEAIIGLAMIGEAQIGQSNGACTVALRIETGPGTGVYTTIASHTFTRTDQLWSVNLPALYAISSTEQVQVRFTNTAGSQLVVRDMALGKRLTFEMGQQRDVAPPSLTSNVIISNSVSVNGSLLGRQSRQVAKEMEIVLEPVTKEWVRSYWEPFAKSAVKLPFYYSWSPIDYPGDVCLAAATNLVAPVNMMPPGYMRCSMPLRVI